MSTQGLGCASGNLEEDCCGRKSRRVLRAGNTHGKTMKRIMLLVSEPWTPIRQKGEELPETNDQDEFLGEMLRLLMERSLSAKDFCVCMWWVSRTAFPGLRGYALRPGSSSGHYQRKLTKVLGVLNRSEKLMSLKMPGRAKDAVGRTENTVKAWPPHEAVDESVRRDPTITTRLLEMVDDRALPPCYFAHPVVRANPEKYVLPLGLFADGVPYSQSDSVIGVWIVNLINGQRNLIAVIRKKRSCDCGCRGGVHLPLALPLAGMGVRSACVREDA